MVWKNFSFNAGLIMSRDTLYGQGLQDDSSTLTGYMLSPGTKYTMYKIPFSKQLQPRLGATWAYNGRDNIYASYARYNPSVNSLPRAASWDRSIQNAFVDVYFDQNGTSYGYKFVESSSGKLFVEDLTPRTTDEFLVGTSRQFKAGAVRARRTSATGTARTSGRTRTTTPGWRSPRLTSINGDVHPEDALHRGPLGPPGADRQRVDLRHHRAGRGVHEVLRGHAGSGMADAARPTRAPPTRTTTTGATSTRTTRRAATTPTSSSGRRTSATAPAANSGTSRTARCAATARTCSSCSAITSSVGTPASAPTSSPSPGSRGRSGATSRTSRSRPARPTRTDTPNRPGRGGRRRIRNSTSITLRTCRSRRGTRAKSRSTSTTSSTARRVQLRPGGAQFDLRRSPVVLRAEAPADGVAAAVLKFGPHRRTRGRRWRRARRSPAGP